MTNKSAQRKTGSSRCNMGPKLQRPCKHSAQAYQKINTAQALTNLPHSIARFIMMLHNVSVMIKKYFFNNVTKNDILLTKI